MKLGRINVRLICQCLLCVLMSRVAFLGMNPVAVAVFVVMYSENRKRNPAAWTVMLGLLTAIFSSGYAEAGGYFLKYGLIIFCIVTINKLAYNRKIYFDRQRLGWIAAVITMLVSLGGGLLSVGEQLIMSVGEGVLVIVLVNLLYKGIQLFEHGRMNQTLSNEQLISLVLVLTIAINGMPNPLPEIFSVSEGCLYMLVLFISYKYGPSSGAIAGAAAGISASIQGQGAVFVGMYCLLGIGIGIVRDMGKWAGIIVFLVSGAALGLMYPDKLWNIHELRAFVSAAAGFAFIPKALLLTSEDENSMENKLIRHSYQQEASRKLSDFAEAFDKLGDMLEKSGISKPVINSSSVGEIFNDLTQTVCGACVNCSYCWEQRYYDTYHEALSMLGSAEQNGRIKKEDVSLDFAARCIHFDDFMRETNQQLEIARVSTDWHNRFALSRMLAAKQMKEVSGLISELESEISGMDRIMMREEEELAALLRAFGIKTKKLIVFERKNRGIEICLNARAPHNACITLKEIADIIGGVMGGRWRAMDCHGTVLPREYSAVVFVPDVKYRVLTGNARAAKDGESVSGDNYSFLTLSNGKMIMTITDGMGSGKLAYDESETVIEMLEQLVEAGFHEDMALRFINSALVYSQNEDIFSTADISVIDLNNGMCDCIKCGASATFIKRKSSVKIVSSDTMPVGILPEASPVSSKHKLASGDFVIMISDGVADSFQAEDREQAIKEIIQRKETDNPQELAEHILNMARNTLKAGFEDDMSVLVAGLWDKL